MVTKSILIKVLGASAAVAPAIGAGVYAVITNQEYEGLHQQIRTLTAQNIETQRSLQEAQELIAKNPEASNAQKDKQLIEQIGKEKTDLEKKITELNQKLSDEEAKNASYFSQKQKLEKDLEEARNGADVKNQGLKQWLKEDILNTDWTKANDYQLYVTFSSGSGLSRSWHYRGFCVDAENKIKTCNYDQSLSQKALYEKIK